MFLKVEFDNNDYVNVDLDNGLALIRSQVCGPKSLWLNIANDGDSLKRNIR